MDHGGINCRMPVQWRHSSKTGFPIDHIFCFCSEIIRTLADVIGTETLLFLIGRNMSSKLPFHEWCIILLFCLIMLTLSAFAFMGKKNVPSTRSSEPQPTVIEVKIDGEVVKPGVYQLPPKSALKELLVQAEPLPTADLSQLRLRRKLFDGQTIPCTGTPLDYHSGTARNGANTRPVENFKRNAHAGTRQSTRSAPRSRCESIK